MYRLHMQKFNIYIAYRAKKINYHTRKYEQFTYTSLRNHKHLYWAWKYNIAAYIRVHSVNIYIKSLFWEKNVLT